MISKAKLLLVGRVRLFVPEEYSQRFLSFLVSKKVKAKIYETDEKNGIYADLSPQAVKKIATALDNLSIKVYIINIKGLYSFLARARHRVGLLLGAVLFFLLLWCSTLIVWRVDISGTCLLPKEQLREELSELGVGVGAMIADINTSGVGNALLLSHPELSWASLDVTGTTVTLTVRETESHQQAEGQATELLVASEAGVIESILVYSGVPSVSKGSVVKAGDVLINGFISGSGLQYSELPILKMGKARGSVIASVSRTVSATVPTEETVSRPLREGRTRVTRTYTVFGKTVFRQKNAPDYPHVTEDRSFALTLFGVLELPITVNEAVYRETEAVTVSRTTEQAEREAMAKATEAVRLGVGQGELISVSYRTELSDTGCTVIADYRCLAEIAIPMKIGISGQ